MQSPHVFSFVILTSSSMVFYFLAFIRPIVPWGARGAGGAMTPPDFGKSVNPISTKVGGRLGPPNLLAPPDFQTVLRPCTTPSRSLFYRACKPNQNQNGYQHSKLLYTSLAESYLYWCDAYLDWQRFLISKS